MSISSPVLRLLSLNVLVEVGGTGGDCLCGRVSELMLSVELREVEERWRRRERKWVGVAILL
jgi:hypothetical protein